MKIKYVAPLFVAFLLVLLMASAAGAPAEIPSEPADLFSISDVSPSKINPGESDTLGFTLENDGGEDADNVIVSWSDTTGDILPVGSSNTKSLGSIDDGDEEDIEFDISASSDAVLGSHKISLLVSYKVNGTSAQQTMETGILVEGSIDFEVVVSDVSEGEVSLSLVNVGSADAEGVIVKLPKQSGYEAVGGSAMSLGKLASNDYVVIPFELDVKDASKDLEVDITYTDVGGARKTVTKDLDIEQSSVSVITGAAVQEGGNGSTKWIVLVILIASAAGVFYWRKKRKKKKVLEG